MGIICKRSFFHQSETGIHIAVAHKIAETETYECVFEQSPYGTQS